MPLTPRRILIVDDDPVVREVVHLVLEDDDVAITEVSNGADAVRVALAEHPDVVVLDIMMPGMTGFDVCRRIRENRATRDAAVVMLTALDSASARQQSSDSGADVYLTKPFSALDLIGAVTEAASRAAR